MGIMFYCFLRNVSWNLILLILSSLLGLSPALELTDLADMSALGGHCSACRTIPLLFKDLSLGLSCDFLQEVVSLIPEFWSLSCFTALKDYKINYW